MAARAQPIRHTPQAGPQTLFASSSADWCIFSSQPGSGKSYANMLELLRWHHLPQYFGVGFRAQAMELVRGPSSLYSTLRRLAPGRPHCTKSPVPELKWPNEATIQLCHANTDMGSFDGTEVALACFDELQHFDREFVEYLAFSRGRTMCGLRPYMRASCMPTPECAWLHDLVKPWLHDDGTQDMAQSGRIRWFVRDLKGVVSHYDNERDAEDAAAVWDGAPTSLAFVFARTADNAALMAADPEYERKNLRRLDAVQRRRLVDGCWEPLPGAGQLFQRGWFRIYDEVPKGQVVASVRGWDRAATVPNEKNQDPDWTRGVRLDLLKSGIAVISDLVSCRKAPAGVHELIQATARLDGPTVKQCFWVDPASSGKDEEATLRSALHRVTGCGPVETRPQGKDSNTYTWACIASAYADRSIEEERPGFGIVRAGWNSQLMWELEQYPSDDAHDDIVSALARGWLTLRMELLQQRMGIQPDVHAFMQSLHRV